MRGQQARGEIYARRAKGDLDLGLEPRRIMQFQAEDFRETLARITTPGGLLPGGIWQDYFTISGTQNFRLGSRMVMDERVFRYAVIGDCSDLAGGATVWAAGIGRPPEYGIGMSPTTITLVKTVAGLTVISGTIGTHIIVLGDLAGVDKDDYAGGYLWMHAGNGPWGCRILGNDEADDDDEVTFYLDAPLPFAALTAGNTVRICHSPYRNVIRHSGPNASVWQSVVGVFCAWNSADGTDLEGQYCWLQTWGPMGWVQIGQSHLGGDSGQRTLYFIGGGSMQAADCVGNGGECPGLAGMATCPQVAGWYMTETSNGVQYGDPCVFLTISP